MTKTKFTLFSVVCLSIGILIGKFILPDLPEIKSSRTVTTTTTIEKIEGIPDTSLTYHSEESEEMIYPESPQSSVGSGQLEDSMQYAIGNRQSEKDSSVVYKKFNYSFGSVDLTVITYPGVDSLKIKAKPEVVTKNIARVDTVKKATSTITTDSVVVTIEKETEWAVHVGSFQFWHSASGGDAYKYAELSYQHKIWFFNVKASAGFYNRLEQSFNGFQPISKLELNIPLN